MSTYKQYSRREFVRILLDNGFTYQRQTGGHAIYKDKRQREISIPSGEPNKMMCKRLIKENNLEV